MDALVFNAFLRNISAEPLPVIDRTIDVKEYVAIDLSSRNSALEGIDVSSSKAWETYIESYLNKRNATVAIGGYLEQRAIYNRSTYFKKDRPDEERNIHLGVDLWCEAGTKVLAVLDGEIHSFHNNKNFGDYGPTIILKHKIDDNTFFSLYGHLNLDSIEEISIGQKVQQGEVIGFLGDSSINGDYAPHLHFQLIRDLQKKFGDYPGVSSKKDLNFYIKNCPNPQLLLKII